MTQPISPAPADDAQDILPGDEGQEFAGDSRPDGALLAELNQLREDNAKLKDQWVRAAAETENVRKRSQREQEETARYAVTGFARDMVSVLENLRRATDSIPADARDSTPLLATLGQGVDLTLQELLGVFTRFGIARLDPMGEKFDHNFHQAVAQVESADHPPGTVMQVVQAGYVIHDRLLRPAMVVVAKAPAAPAEKVDTTA